MGEKKISHVHVCDVLAGVTGRDQPIMMLNKAHKLAEFLDKKLFLDDDVVFFDPFSKAGEVLLATAIVYFRNKNKQKLVNLNTIQKTLYESNIFFGLTPDERHYFLSKRTFYGNEKSHDQNLRNIKNGAYLSETDGKLDEQKFKKELNTMLDYIKTKTNNKKIIAIGNPPYHQDTKGFGKQAKPIYNILIESLIDSNKIEEFLVVIPARWFSGGMGLKSFREKIQTSKNVKTIKYFQNSNDVFSSVDIRGGICFLNWSKQLNKETIIIDNEHQKSKIDLFSYDVIVPHSNAHPILDKIKEKGIQTISNQEILPMDAFGLTTDYFKKNAEHTKENFLDCYTARKQIKKICKSKILKNKNLINKYKVAFPKATGGGKGKRYKILPKPSDFFILRPSQVTTATYCVSKGFETLKEVENFKTFLTTDFARFLIALRKPTQDTLTSVFAFVPYMDPKQEWTDKKLFEYFGITKKEQEYIKEKVDEWT